MQRQLAIVSGPRGSGKTMLCLRLIELARQRGLGCAGIISLARFREGHKVGIDALDVRSGERRLLAEADQLQPAPLCPKPRAATSDVPDGLTESCTSGTL